MSAIKTCFSDRDTIRVQDDRPGVVVAAYPALLGSVEGGRDSEMLKGGWSRMVIPAQPPLDLLTTAEPLADPGPLQEIRNGLAGVAEQPSDEDFANAAVWKIHIPGDLNGKTKNP